jgi:hypothetical protein
VDNSAATVLETVKDGRLGLLPLSLFWAAPDGPTGRATRLPLCARSGAQPTSVVAPPQSGLEEKVRFALAVLPIFYRKV